MLVGVFAAGAQAATFEFPSSSSTVVSSGASLPDAFGYFWSKARGDKVAQTFLGPPAIDHAVLTIQAPQNSLGAGLEVDWTLSINGADVGSFVVPAGNTDPIVLDRSFAPVAGPNYAVEIRVTNEVSSGGGSHSFASTASTGQHSLVLTSKTAPDTQITSGPVAATTETTAAFTFASPQLVDVKGFQCSLDHTSFVPCASPRLYGTLSLGPHSFEVSAVGIFDNADATPAAWQWTVVAVETPKGKAKAKGRKCKRGFKKVKRHGKSVCVKKKHHKPKKQNH